MTPNRKPQPSMEEMMIPHVVTGTIDLKTGKVTTHQCTRKEDAIYAIKQQPFFGGINPLAGREDGMETLKAYRLASRLFFGLIFLILITVSIVIFMVGMCEGGYLPCNFDGEYIHELRRG